MAHILAVVFAPNFSNVTNCFTADGATVGTFRQKSGRAFPAETSQRRLQLVGLEGRRRDERTFPAVLQTSGVSAIKRFLLFVNRVTRILPTIAGSSPKSLKGKKGQNIYNKAAFESQPLLKP
jgi:hypothetical protein